ncbi:acyl-CoA N-acyltransferase [Xylaria sp. CBS 124048]|nr:acyl-CoA N-acyltransferase [Xylaria sp. CBS 124048]
MASETDRLGAVVKHSPALPPSPDITLSGRWVKVVGMNAGHIEPLFAQISGDENTHLWDYMLTGPFANLAEFRAATEYLMNGDELVLYAIIPVDEPTTSTGADNVIGYAGYLSIKPSHCSVEVGHVLFSPKLQRTPHATEAMYLMAKYAIEELGYRRYEWKCNTLNKRSWRAALRLGFTYEGIFRQHMVIKGRNRDTAWFAIIDKDWPGIKAAFDGWLEPSNFDEDGSQKRRLEDFRIQQN